MQLFPVLRSVYVSTTAIMRFRKICMHVRSICSNITNVIRVTVNGLVISKTNDTNDVYPSDSALVNIDVAGRDDFDSAVV